MENNNNIFKLLIYCIAFLLIISNQKTIYCSTLNTSVIEILFQEKIIYTPNIKWNLVYKDIGFYNIIAPNYVKDNTKLFFHVHKHPLIYWKLQLFTESISYNLDLITNITSKPKNDNILINNHLLHHIINDVYFVHSPSIIYKENEFLLNFIKNHNTKSFFNLAKFNMIEYEEFLQYDLKINHSKYKFITHNIINNFSTYNIYNKLI